MAASGIVPNASCQTAFYNLQMKKELRYVIYGIENDEITVQATQSKSEDQKDPKKTYEAFYDVLAEKECCWVAYDFEYDLGENGKRNKIIFIAWVPDSLSGIKGIRQRMLYSSSKDALRKTLTGIGADIQANDLSNLEYDEILTKLGNK